MVMGSVRVCISSPSTTWWSCSLSPAKARLAVPRSPCLPARFLASSRYCVTFGVQPGKIRHPTAKPRCFMATFVATTASNDPALKDVDAGRKVLNRYVFDGELQAEISQEGGQGQSCLSIYGYDWPGA